MNDSVPARVVAPEFGHKDLLKAGPGAMWVIGKRLAVPGSIGTTDERWNVCCPGCGTLVYNLSSVPVRSLMPDGTVVIDPGYTFTGDVTRPETLSIAEVVDFVPCGCRKFRLTNGWWRRGAIIIP